MPDLLFTLLFYLDGDVQLSFTLHPYSPKPHPSSPIPQTLTPHPPSHPLTPHLPNPHPSPPIPPTTTPHTTPLFSYTFFSNVVNAMMVKWISLDF